MKKIELNFMQKIDDKFYDEICVSLKNCYFTIKIMQTSIIRSILEKTTISINLILKSII